MTARWKTWLLYGLIWLAGGMVLTTQLYLTVVPRGLGVTLQEVAVGQYARVALWLLLCPVVIWLLRVLPLEGSRRWANLGLHAAASFAAMLLNYVFRMVVWEFYGQSAFVDFGQRLLLAFNGRALADVAIYWSIVAVAAGLALLHRQHELEMARSRLQIQLAESELRALKQQLQPHFLFNTLNSITMLVRQKQEERAVDTIAALSALLRRLIDSGRQQEVPFSAELDFTQHYLDIEQTRFGNRLKVDYDVAKEALNAAVPSLLLQPLVENAVKHGISRRTLPGRIRITAAVEQGRIRIEVCNDNADAAAQDVSGTHLGLETTRQRLGRIYGSQFELDCAFNGPEGARVAVALPFREASPGDRNASHEPDQNTHR
jgi:signal transduction histidine kinase